MGLRFLADHCISNSIIQTLRDGGHEVIRLRDVLPAGSPDSAVIQKAQDSGAILLSLEGISPTSSPIHQRGMRVSWRFKFGTILRRFRRSWPGWERI
jgi:hypothetical protein